MLASIQVAAADHVQLPIQMHVTQDRRGIHAFSMSSAERPGKVTLVYEWSRE